MADQSPRSRVRTRIVVEERLLRLLPGVYFIGRGGECDLVLDDPSVSRRHARLAVGLDGASIQDLDSVNGVFLNGLRIATAEPLEDGDVLIVGNRELAVQLVPHSTLPPPRETLPATTLTPLPPGRAAATRPLTAQSATTRVNALDLLGAVAERALAKGDRTQAEQAVRARLLDTLQEARQEPRSVNGERMARALALALRLARAGCPGGWLSYAVELLAAVNEPCTDALAAELRAVTEDSVEPGALDSYARAVVALPASIDRSRTLALIEELRRPLELSADACSASCAPPPPAAR
jgi:pSer/pThr/pTyr-binding forkhead associated (FHA) protein